MRAGAIVLAGGEATRFPGKVELAVSGTPFVVRAVRSAAGRETFVSCRGTFSPGVDALVRASCVVDHMPLRGPLGGLISTAARMRSRFVFALAADAPLLDAAFLTSLEAAWRSGDEAVVPATSGRWGERRMEPLAALYDRLALLREGAAELRRGGAVRGMLARMRVRIIDAGAETFANVNTPEDYVALAARIGAQL